MIEFIQDYVTKALPPESFKDGEQVANRSADSELYFVRLGVAGFVVDGKLVDQDYLPITRQTIAVVVSPDRRFADTGRAGEVIGLEAPQRATSGPGNDVVFSGQPDSTTLGGVEFEQLRADLASSRGEFEKYQTTSTGEIERLKGLIDAGNDAFREMNNSHVTDKDDLQLKIERLTSDLASANASLEAGVEANAKAILDLGDARQSESAANARIAELERLLADATKPPSSDATATKPAKTK